MNEEIKIKILKYTEYSDSAVVYVDCDKETAKQIHGFISALINEDNELKPINKKAIIPEEI